MFIRLTTRLRIWTGWLVAVAYLFCVLAPDAALALGVGPLPCLRDDISVFSVPIMHMHGIGSTHSHGGMHTFHHADFAGIPAKHEGKTSSRACCVMMCVIGLPADLPAIVKPLQPVSICAREVYRHVEDKASPLLYRPPIT